MNLSRRQVLGSLGALIATKALGDVPCFFPARGKYERLCLAYQRIECGATKPFSILHLSDTHLTNVGIDEPLAKQKLHRVRTKTFGGRQEEALADSLAWAKDNVDYVLHTGDLIDFQSEANLATVKKYFGENTNLFGCLGNHEYSPNMGWDGVEDTHDEAQKAKTKECLKTAYPFDLELQSQVINGVNFVTMDDVFGYVTAHQVERFAAEVKKGLPIVICVHVPFYTDKIWQADNKYWNLVGKKFDTAEIPAARGDYKVQKEDKVTREFLAYLKAEPLLKGVLAGHTHISIQDRFSSTAMEYVVGANFMFHGQEILFV